MRDYTSTRAARSEMEDPNTSHSSKVWIGNKRQRARSRRASPPSATPSCKPHETGSADGKSYAVACGNIFGVCKQNCRPVSRMIYGYEQEGEKTSAKQCWSQEVIDLALGPYSVSPIQLRYEFDASKCRIGCELITT